MKNQTGVRLSGLEASESMSLVVHSTNERALGERTASLVRAILALAVLVLSGAAAQAADELVDYAKQIKPVLRERCFACHGALKQEAGLRLDTAAFAIKGGSTGAAIQPGNVAASLLIKRVAATDESERMPPEGEPLTPAQIEALRKWIGQKAPAPSDEQPERDPRDHWAFKTPQRPSVPTSSDPLWNKNPIDAFIAREHQQRALKPQRVADKRIWLRRVSLDLIGLPPTLEQQDQFLSDTSSDAYDKVVTRLLDSPQYGERWGRHWMDVWRYSDWWGLGAEVRNSQKHIWHWRDWIIDSLNADKGYDQMLREMLAADELAPNDLDQVRATGFLARQYFIFNRTSWLDETIEHTSKAMLGLTFNCCKCHDHKYDPLAQVDYYRLRAIFEPYQVRMDAVPGEFDFQKDGMPRAFDCNLTATTRLHLRGNDQNPDPSRVIEPSVPAFLTQREFKIEPVSLPAEAVQPGLRAFVVETHRRQAERDLAEARAALAVAKKKLSDVEAAAKTAPSNPDPVKADPAVSTAKPTPSGSMPPVIKDDFAAAKPEWWQQLGGEWSYANGKLIQSKAGMERTALRLKPAPPTDFEAKLKYIPTGGMMWKSVGINFDVTESGNEVMAYLSSFAGGPKSQVSYKAGGTHVYPANAAQARKIDLKQPHELVLRVRGTLINVTVDGEASIAYRLPIARQKGVLEIISFDAQVEFLSFELSELAPSVVLMEAVPTKPAKSTEAPTTEPQTVDQARLAVVIGEKAIIAAEAQVASVMARATADRARANDPKIEATRDVVRAAAKSEVSVTFARADEALSKAELALLQAAAGQKPDAEKKVAAARVALDAARKLLDVPSEKYMPLPGALKTPESNLESAESKAKAFPATSTGRRSAFAKWLTDPQHPLPARVAVNHIWMRHLGKPLVPTVFDFGRKGTPPTHPELLDWLAVELVEHKWSMKHIHRLIVTSQVYRLSSSMAEADGKTLTSDGDNRFYWRANPIRMEAQLVRDSLLHLAGELDLKLGGPSIPVADEGSRRRSLYFVHSHNEHQKFLEVFDDANVLDCYRRLESIVPQQALALENSSLAHAMATKITERLTASSSSSSDEQFIRAAFLTVLATEPTAAEQALVTKSLEQFVTTARTKKHPSPEAHARIGIIQALLNHNDFVTVR